MTPESISEKVKSGVARSRRYGRNCAGLGGAV